MGQPPTRGMSSDLEGHSVSQQRYVCSLGVSASTSMLRARADFVMATSSGMPACAATQAFLNLC